ncbi:MAG: hypothetical protein J3K34DRAFT_386464 [Monoraphidium minutum]|nr:MAG: hypothetical protein J3K34DRAFT_386464 [Monoraphidium minutum]
MVDRKHVPSSKKHSHSPAAPRNQEITRRVSTPMGSPARLLAALCAISIAHLADSVNLPPGPVLIKGGTVVNHDGAFRADVLIRDQLIAAVGLDLQVPKRAKIIDASGHYVMPGGIDPHTHLDMPFMGQVACDDFYTGQAAALAGGTTMHIDFALPIDHDLQKGFDTWQAKAVRGCADYGLHMAVTSWSDKVAGDMGELTKKGINSFKFFMAYKGALMVTDGELVSGFTRCKELGALPQVHAENGDAVAEGQRRVFESGITGPEGHALSRPAVLEAEATGRAIRLAAWVGVPLYVVHVMSAGAAEEVARARQRGERVIGEPVASGLALNESWLWHPDFKTAAAYVMSPPIRAAADGAALRAALAGGALQIVATDHAVFNSTQKAVGRRDFRVIPNGVNGIEERMHVVWEEMVNSGLMGPADYVRVTSTAAAQAFNIYPRKGRIAVGSDADVIVFDPERRHVIRAATHHSAIDTNVYEGKRIKGKVVVTVSRGRVVWENGKLDVRPGTARYVPLPTHSYLFDGLEKRDAARRASPYGDTPVARPAGGGKGGGGAAGGGEAAGSGGGEGAKDEL